MDMERRQVGDVINSLRMARLWTVIGDTAQAFDWLDRAHSERNPGLIFLRYEAPLHHFLRTRESRES